MTCADVFVVQTVQASSTTSSKSKGDIARPIGALSLDGGWLDDDNDSERASIMTTLRKRVFVSWSEFRGMAVADYEASETVDACRPVRADEVMVHSGTSGRHVIEPRIVLHSRRCGEVAVYRPGIGDDGRPFVQRIRSVVDGERCERGHRLCCPGRHECSLCVNDRREASMAKLTWEELADPDESWRRVLRRAKQLSEQRRAEVDGLEAAFNADAESPTGADSEDTAGRDSTLGETLMGDADE